MLGGVGAFGNNMVNLATLQARLLKIDVAEASRLAVPALVVLILAVLAIPSAFVLAALGLALWLIDSGTLSPPLAHVAVGAGILVLTALAAVGAALVLRKSLAAFRSSVEELQRNLAWVQTVLTQSGR